MAIDLQRTNTAIAFDHSKDDFLIQPASAVNLLCSLTAMHVAGLAADHVFVNFHFARQLVTFIVLHGKPNQMEREPCGLLSHAKRPMDFPRANPVLVINDHPYARKPLGQRYWPILENSSSLKAEL